jgi:hypothetical protein
VPLPLIQPNRPSPVFLGSLVSIRTAPEPASTSTWIFCMISFAFSSLLALTSLMASTRTSLRSQASTVMPPLVLCTSTCPPD